MTFVALIILLLLSGVGALGVASPSRFLGVMRSFLTPMGLLFAAALRVILGVALLRSAPESRVPELLLVLGVVIIVRGVVTPFLGVERLRRLLDRLSARGALYLRWWAILTMMIGLSLMYAIVPAV